MEIHNSLSCSLIWLLTVGCIRCLERSESVHISPELDDEKILLEGCHEDIACLIRASEDRQGLDAIKQLHGQLDDDQNGSIDLAESKDFLLEELKYEKGAEKRQNAFHKDDTHISVKELWEAWIKSEVHNWTVEQTAEWMSSSVELPQYVPIFIVKRVTGAHLPRLATGNGQYISNVIGIKDPIHKQKIMLKAMDAVLFGPPKIEISYTKDIILVTLLACLLSGIYFAHRQKQQSSEHLQRMMKDIEGLQKAELDLKNLQVELEKTEQEKLYVTQEKQNLEKKLNEQSTDLNIGQNLNLNVEVENLKDELQILRSALQKAEGQLENKNWCPPVDLQMWLQLTHEIESRSYAKKKVIAEKQLEQAKDACDKLRKRRSNFVGAFISTHGKSIDEVDRSIVEARTSLGEVTKELAERVNRWKQIEALCGFTICTNKGLPYLESTLYKGSSYQNKKMHGPLESQDTFDDDLLNNQLPH